MGGERLTYHEEGTYWCGEKEDMYHIEKFHQYYFGGDYETLHDVCLITANRRGRKVKEYEGNTGSPTGDK